MANINEILARAAALRDETALNSISPERAGGIMYDTLLALNELWLQQGTALVISKIYASVAAMEADTEPVSDLTGKPLRPGQIVVIASSDSDNGSVYRYNGTESPSWSLVGSIGNLDPVDSLDSDSTTLPLAAHQGKVLDSKISQLGQKVLNPIDLGLLTGLQDANFNLALLLNQNSCDKSETEITTDITATIPDSFLDSNGQIVSNERGFSCRIYQIQNSSIIKYLTAADYSSCAIFDEYPILNATGKIVFSTANTNTQGNIAVKAGQYIVVTYYSAALAFTRLFNVTYNFTKSPIKEIDGDSKTVSIKSAVDVEYVMPKVNFDFTNNITANNDGSLAASYIDASTMKVISNANGWSIKYYHILEPGKYKYKYLANYGLVSILDEIPSIGADVEKIIYSGTGEDINKEGIFSVEADKYVAITYHATPALGKIELYKGEAITGIKEEVTITCSRYGTSGVDADYCGLNAIGDALDAITDASPDKVYNILVRGHFLFTNPKLVSDGGDFKYYDDRMVSIFNGKDYCNIIGVDKEQAILEVRLSNDLQESDFPVINGQRVTFTDYQTCYIRTNSVCKNIQFVSTNCRYTVHLENANGSATWDMLFENCEFLRNPGVKGYSGVVVFGLAPSCTLKFIDCKFVGQGNSSFVGGHSVLHNVSDKDSACRVIAENCDFIGSGNLIGVGTGTYNRQDVYSIINCRVSKWLDIELSDMSNRKRNLGTLPILNCDSLPIPYASSLANSYGLRVRAISGNGSSVRFDENSSAFDIVGNAEDLTKVYTDWGSIKSLGYEYKDDEAGSYAYAASWVNCHPTGGNSLGSILGDCSINNKILTIVINGVSYNIIFDQNYTSVDNDTILAEINAVIGSVAVADFFNPESFQYPHYKDVVYNCYNSQDTLISKGMGVVITGVSSAINSIQSVIVRKAKATDGHIDGIALDDIGSSQRGRIVQKGLLYCKENGNGYAYFSIYPANLQLSYGDRLSIDSNNDGCFIVSGSAPVLRAISENYVEII